MLPAIGVPGQPYCRRAPITGARFVLPLCALPHARPGIAAAQDYPTQPVSIVVPFAAGGGTDALARFLAQGPRERLGQPFIIENRAGAGDRDRRRLRRARRARRLHAAGGNELDARLRAELYKKLAYDPTKDFSPISLVAAVPFVLVVNPSLPVNSVAELVALAKARPGELSYASGGIGAPHHIYMELFMSMTGIDMKHVPYRGGGPALNDVVAGHVPIISPMSDR